MPISNPFTMPQNSTESFGQRIQLLISLTDGSFIETFAFVQEMRNVLGIHLE